MPKLNAYKLLLPEQASAVERFAADELDGIFRLCGLPAPRRVVRAGAGDTVISLGETSLKVQYGFTADPNYGGGYNIRTADGHVFIYAPEPSGVINGAYGFAERVVGYRFYAMDEIRLEARAAYEVPELDVSDRPDFMGRRLDSYNLYHDPVYSLRLKQNAACQDDDPRLGESTPWATLHDQSLAFQLVPRETYETETYIEKGWWAEKGSQLCWTKALYDAELYGLLRDRLIEVVRREPDKKFYMLGQTDNRHYCECETCRRDYAKYGVSGVLLRLVNRLADDVKAFIAREQGGREHYLCMFAYLQTVDPPVRTENGRLVPLDKSVIARDNVMIRIAPIESGVLYSHLDTRVNPFSAAAFIGWRAVAKHFAIWDYGTDFSAYDIPYPDWDTFPENLRFFKEYGAVDLLTQLPAHTGGTEFYAMKMYVRARLMWDTSLDAGALTEEFIDAYYGPAAPYIREYLALLRAHYADLKENCAYAANIYVPLMQAVYWPFSLLEEIDGIFVRAFAAAAKEKDPARRAAVEKRLRCESLSYRLVRFDAYKHRFTLEEQTKNVDEFERDAAEAGLIAFSNGWKQGRGKLVDLIADHRKRLKSMRLAEELSAAEDNPLRNFACLKRFPPEKI